MIIYSMQCFNNRIKEKFSEKKNLKIITGLNNFNLHDIVKLVNTAEMVNATYLDVSANPFVVREVKKYVKLPLCVSSISLHDLYACALEGADILEIGNYDYFYQNRLFLSKKHIFNLANEARRIFPSLDLCVTIPYTLSLEEQIHLGRNLENIGVQILQTESLKPRLDIKVISLTDFITMAFPVLSSTYAISKSVSIPVIAASGMNCVTASLAMLYGASGIGIGTSLMSYSSALSRFAYLKEVHSSIQANKIISFYNTISCLQPYNNLLS